MKTLALLRHAKAGRIAPGSGDFERCLTPRGVEAAPAMGRALRNLGVSPDLVLCSKARRASETWNLVGPELDGVPQVQIHPALYLAEPQTLLKSVQGIEATDIGVVLLVGHNPGLEWLAGTLSGPESDPGAVRGLADGLPTAGLVILTFEATSWRDVGQDEGRLTHFLRPGDLG